MGTPADEVNDRLAKKKIPTGSVFTIQPLVSSSFLDLRLCRREVALPTGKGADDNTDVVEAARGNNEA
jgi:hypothetical protein